MKPLPVVTVVGVPIPAHKLASFEAALEVLVRLGNATDAPSPEAVAASSPSAAHPADTRGHSIQPRRA